MKKSWQTKRTLTKQRILLLLSKLHVEGERSVHGRAVIGGLEGQERSKVKLGGRAQLLAVRQTHLTSSVNLRLHNSTVVQRVRETSSHSGGLGSQLVSGSHGVRGVSGLRHNNDSQVALVRSLLKLLSVDQRRGDQLALSEAQRQSGLIQTSVSLLGQANLTLSAQHKLVVGVLQDKVQVELGVLTSQVLRKVNNLHGDGDLNASVQGKPLVLIGNTDSSGLKKKEKIMRIKNRSIPN